MTGTPHETPMNGRRAASAWVFAVCLGLLVSPSKAWSGLCKEVGEKPALPGWQNTGICHVNGQNVPVDQGNFVPKLYGDDPNRIIIHGRCGAPFVAPAKDCAAAIEYQDVILKELTREPKCAENCIAGPVRSSWTYYTGYGCVLFKTVYCSEPKPNAKADSARRSPRPRTSEEALRYLRKAGVKLDFLASKGYTPDGVKDLAWAIMLASEHMKDYYQTHPDTYADYYKNGTVANAASPLCGNLDRGCNAHTRETFGAVSAVQHQPGASLDVNTVIIGLVLEHHAVVVYPKGTDWKDSGIILDAWGQQSEKPKDMTFTVPQWTNEHRVLLTYLGVRLDGPKP